MPLMMGSQADANMAKSAVAAEAICRCDLSKQSYHFSR